jgi:predicted transcriptional regulator
MAKTLKRTANGNVVVNSNTEENEMKKTEMKKTEKIETSTPTIEELMKQVAELTAQLTVTRKKAETAGGGRMLEVYNALLEHQPCSTEKLAKVVGISTHNIGSQLSYLRDGKGLDKPIPIGKTTKGLHIMEKKDDGTYEAFVKAPKKA